MRLSSRCPPFDLQEGMRMPGLVSTGPASQPANTRGNAGPRRDERACVSASSPASQPATKGERRAAKDDECVCADVHGKVDGNHHAPPVVFSSEE